MREIVKSKDKQIASLHSHVKVLESTVELLKNDLCSMVREGQSKNIDQDEAINFKEEANRLRL